MALPQIRNEVISLINMPKHTLYFSDAMFKKMAIDTAGSEGLSGRVSRLCSIALDVMDENIPPLELGEWCTLVDVSNSQHLGDSTPREMAHSFRFSIMESGPECNEKWNVKCVELAQKYAALPLAAQLAAIEVCRRFWVLSDINAKFDNYRDILAAHGAKFVNANAE